MEVNIEKSKVMVFRNGGKISNADKLYYDGKLVETVDKFSYLGFIFYYNNKFTVAERHLPDQGRKAAFALCSKMNSLYLNTETILSLFDCYITSILCYASEVWGYIKGKAVERVYVDFCKRLLGIKRSTNNSMMYAELGHVPLRANILFNMIRYWHRILKTNNCILKACYSYLYECVEIYNEHNWAYHVKQELFMLGFGELWINQHR